MSITVKRRTKYIRVFAPIYLKINGKRLTHILENEDLELPLSDTENLLSIRASRKTQISVTNGDIITIKDNTKNAIAFWFGVLIIVLGQFFFVSGSWTMAILTWIGLASIIASFFIPRFLLEKAEQ